MRKNILFLILQERVGVQYNYLNNNYRDIKFDILILCHFINDIEGDIVIAEKESSVENSFRKKNRIIEFIINRSYFFNFLYYRIEYPSGKDYFKNLINLYNQEQNWREHCQTILKIRDIANVKKAKFLFVILPPLDALRNYHLYSDLFIKIKEFVTQEGILYIDLTDFLKDYKPSDLVVNKFDGHYNEKAHEIVAMNLFDFLLKHIFLKSDTNLVK